MRVCRARGPVRSPRLVRRRGRGARLYLASLRNTVHTDYQGAGGCHDTCGGLLTLWFYDETLITAEVEENVPQIFFVKNFFHNDFGWRNEEKTVPSSLTFSKTFTCKNCMPGNDNFKIYFYVQHSHWQRHRNKLKNLINTYIHTKTSRLTSSWVGR